MLNITIKHIVSFLIKTLGLEIWLWCMRNTSHITLFGESFGLYMWLSLFFSRAAVTPGTVVMKMILHPSHYTFEDAKE